MPADAPTIVASSIGFDYSGRNALDASAGPIFDYCAERSGAEGSPKLCFVGTASGDTVTSIAAAYAAFARRFSTSHLAVFTMPNIDDVRGHLLEQDIVWVGGGSVANLLALWRLHGWDEIFRDAWQAGVVLGGVSAGSICWHLGGTTDSFGPTLQPVTNGLAFLPYSNGVHYDKEEQRRPLYHSLLENGTLPPGYASDDGVALVYQGTQLVEVVADRADCFGYSVRLENGQAVEDVLETRRLR